MLAHTPISMVPMRPTRSVVHSNSQFSQRTPPKLAPRQSLQQPSILKRHFSSDPQTTLIGGLAVAGFGVGTVAALVSRYKVAQSNEYIAWTGLGIKDIVITKKGFQFP